MSTMSASRYFDFSPTDRALAVLHDDAPFALQLDLEFDARLDTARLVEALRLVSRRHPILTATVDRFDARAQWRAGTTTPAFVDVADAPATMRRSFDSLDVTDLDLATGPTMVVAHLPCATSSRLVLGIHHAVADGRGLLLVLDDLRRSYVALATGDDHDVDVDWNPRTVASLFAAQGVTLDERARLTWDVVRRWTTTPRSTHADAPGDADASGRHTAIDLDDALIEALDARARTRGWRLNHVMLALLARSWSRAFGDEPASRAISGWLVSVDSRRQFHTARGVGNLSGLEPVTLTEVADIDLAQLIDESRVAFGSLTRQGAGLAADLMAPPTSLIPVEASDRATRDTIALRTTALRSTRLYSHTDRLPEELGDWGTTELKALRWLPPRRVAAPYVAFVLVRYRGVTAMTPFASTASLAPDDAATLAGQLRASLAELADSI